MTQKCALALVDHPAWQETKTAVLRRVTHHPVDSDPQPDLPECFAGASELSASARPPVETIDPSAEPDHPWCMLQREQGDLRNNMARLDYPRYGRSGLPITSRPIESWIKQLNRRVKGSEKFWNDNNSSEAILPLRIDGLGDDEA